MSGRCIHVKALSLATNSGDIARRLVAGDIASNKSYANYYCTMYTQCIVGRIAADALRPTMNGIMHF